MMLADFSDNAFKARLLSLADRLANRDPFAGLEGSEPGPVATLKRDR